MPPKSLALNLFQSSEKLYCRGEKSKSPLFSPHTSSTSCFNSGEGEATLKFMKIPGEIFSQISSQKVLIWLKMCQTAGRRTSMFVQLTCFSCQTKSSVVWRDRSSIKVYTQEVCTLSATSQTKAVLEGKVCVALDKHCKDFFTTPGTPNCRSFKCSLEFGERISISSRLKRPTTTVITAHLL